jgi:AcrR family transcriptional regulator
MKSARAYTMSSRADAVASTKERIATAALELLMERRYDDVTLTDIATAAGVSHQTVLNHFESKEGVAFAAADLVVASTNDARSGVTPGDTVGAIRRLVSDYEQIGDANARWAMDVEHLGSLAPLIEQARHSHRAWLEAAFGPFLPADAKARRRVVNALHAATDVYTWKLLRRDLGVTRAETERTMVRLVDGALGRLDGDT